MLLTADFGSDGYSTFVNGMALTLDVSFWVVVSSLRIKGSIVDDRLTRVRPTPSHK